MPIQRGFGMMAVSAILGGCALVFGLGDPVEDPTTPQSGSDATDDALGDALAQRDAAVPEGGFIVVRTTGWIDENGVRTVEAAPIDEPIELFVARDAGLAGPFAPSSAPDRLSYRDLPAGDRVVIWRTAAVFSPRVHVVSGDRLDIGGNSLGRPGRAVAAPGSTLKIVATGASDAGAPNPTTRDFVGGMVRAVGLPDPTTTSPFTWNVTWPAEVVDGTKGDRVWVLRTRANGPSGGVWEVCPFPLDYRMNGGGTSTVNVTCTSAPRQAVSVSLQQPTPPAGTTPTQFTNINLWLAPSGGAFGDLGDAVAYAFGAADGTPLAMEFVNPALAANRPKFTLTARADQSFVAPRVASNGSPFDAYSSVAVCGPVAIGAPTALRASVGFVEAVTIGGKDALGPVAISGVGPTPTIAWSAPSTGSANLYTVQLYDVERQKFVVLTTARTAITVPQNILDDREYRVSVAAVEQVKGADQEPNRLPCGTSTHLTTNPFRP